MHFGNHSEAPRMKKNLLSPHFPFSPAKSPFFYGWVIMGVGIIGTLASIPGQTIGVGVFKEALLHHLSIEELSLSMAYMLGTIVSAALLPWAGNILDQWGARFFILVATLSLAVSLVVFSQVDRLLSLVDAPPIWLSVAVVAFCYLLLRFFGQGCLTMACRFLLGNWFNHHRGLAAGITGVFVGLGFSGSPQVLNLMVTGWGWRETALVLALLVGPGMGAIGWLFVRDNPEECGLVPDGITDEATLARMREKVPDVQKEFTRGEAVHTLAFWAFAAGVGVIALLATAVAFHIATIGRNQGISRDVAYSIFLPSAFVAVVSNFLSAWLSDRIKLRWILQLMLVGVAFALVSLTHLSTPAGRLGYIIAMGTSTGIFGVLLTVVWPRYFGRRHLGAISGLNTSIMVFSSALGPILFSLGQAWTGSYQIVMLASVAIPVTLLMISPWVENPQRA